MDIYTLPLGMSNAYFLANNSEAVLIDGGFPGHENKVFTLMQKLGMEPADLKLIIATHGHHDHVGSIHAIKEYTGARFAIHEADLDLLKSGRVNVPPATSRWGRIIRALLLARGGQFLPVEPDIIIKEDMSLAEWGIDARTIHTPGHTAGSVSVVLASGEAFVGCLAMNGFPLRRGPGMPAFAEDVELVYKGWEKISSAGATMIFPSHGKAFPTTKLKKK